MTELSPVRVVLSNSILVAADSARLVNLEARDRRCILAPGFAGQDTGIAIEVSVKAAEHIAAEVFVRVEARIAVVVFAKVEERVVGRVEAGIAEVIAADTVPQDIGPGVAAVDIVVAAVRVVLEVSEDTVAEELGSR